MVTATTFGRPWCLNTPNNAFHATGQTTGQNRTEMDKTVRKGLTTAETSPEARQR